MTSNLHNNKTGRLPIAKQGDSLLSSRLLKTSQDWKIMGRREPLVGVGTLIIYAGVCLKKLAVVVICDRPKRKLPIKQHPLPTSRCAANYELQQ